MLQAIEYLKARISDTERGAAAVEYALLIALIAAAIVTAVGLFAGHLSSTFDTVRGKF